MQNKKIDMAGAVMSRIKKEKITIKPKWRFVVGSLVLFAGIVVLAVLSVFMVSLISFSLKTHGPMGEYRFQQLLSAFPWWAFILAAGGVWAGVLLMRKYDFSYRNNFTLIIIAFVLAIVATGYLADYLGIDNYASRQGIMRGIYRQYDGGYRGGRYLQDQKNYLFPRHRNGTGRQNINNE